MRFVWQDFESSELRWILSVSKKYIHGKYPLLTFTCSKSTIETIEKGVIYIQSKQYELQNDVIVIVHHMKKL